MQICGFFHFFFIDFPAKRLIVSPERCFLQMNYFDDLRITSCGMSPDPGSTRVPPGGSREYSTVLPCPACPNLRCQAGRGGSVSIGIIHGNTFWRHADHCREITRPFVYWLRDDEYFAWCNPRRAERENRWIIFEGARSLRMLEALDALAGGEHFYLLDDPKPLEYLFDEIRRQFRTLTPATSYRVMPLFETLMVRLYDCARAEHADTRLFRIVKEAEQQIRQAPQNHFNLAAFAESHHVSYDHFRESFRRYLGVPPYDFLLDCRLNIAKKMLREQTFSIKEIAERCGFGRPSDFARFFRRRTGLSPSEFIRSPGVS